MGPYHCECTLPALTSTLMQDTSSACSCMIRALVLICTLCVTHSSLQHAAYAAVSVNCAAKAVNSIHAMQHTCAQPSVGPSRALPTLHAGLMCEPLMVGPGGSWFLPCMHTLLGILPLLWPRNVSQDGCSCGLIRCTALPACPRARCRTPQGRACGQTTAAASASLLPQCDAAAHDTS